MTNAEKFMEVMNKTFNAGFTPANLIRSCSPCGSFKYGMCHLNYIGVPYNCKGCYSWWDKEYVEPEEAVKNAID